MNREITFKFENKVWKIFLQQGELDLGGERRFDAIRVRGARIGAIIACGGFSLG